MAFEKKVSIAIVGKTKGFTDDLTRVQKRLKGLGSFAAGAGKAIGTGLGIATVAGAALGKQLVD